MEVIIMRGLPGSGKSTWVKDCILPQGREVRNSHVVCSADDHHMVMLNGKWEYRYNPANAVAAHNTCLSTFLSSLQTPIYDRVVVDNTNTAAWEIAPYHRLAEALGYKVKIVRVYAAFEECLRPERNTHKVPHRTLWQMWQNLLTERLPPHWVEEIVTSAPPRRAL